MEKVLSGLWPIPKQLQGTYETLERIIKDYGLWILLNLVAIGIAWYT